MYIVHDTMSQILYVYNTIEMYSNAPAISQLSADQFYIWSVNETPNVSSGSSLPLGQSSIPSHIVPTVAILASAAKVASTVPGGVLPKVLTYGAVGVMGVGMSAASTLVINATPATINSVLRTPNLIRSNVPGSNGTGTHPKFPISSVLEPGDMGPQGVFTIVPRWMQLHIDGRISPTLGVNSGTYELLFTQYNLLVYLLCIALFIIVLATLLLWILTRISAARDKLTSRFPKVMGWLFNATALKVMIMLNWAGLLINFAVVLQIVYFMYTHSFPGDLGVICDNAIAAN